MNRRKFIIQGGMTAGAMLLNGSSFASSSSSKLTILHTNDVHSRLDPFPMDGTRNAGMEALLQGQKSSATSGPRKPMFCCWMQAIFFREHPISTSSKESQK